MTDRPRPSHPRVISNDPTKRPKAGFADLLPRALSGAVLVVIALGTAVLGGPWFAAVWWGVSLAIVWEWQTIVGGASYVWRLCLGGAALSLTAALTFAEHPGAALLALGAGSLLVALCAVAPKRLLSGAGVLYAGALLVSVLLLRHSASFGLQSILWLFAVVWGTDIMAYFGGRLIGGPKLWERVSPSKTWSGFLVGVTSGALAGLAVAPASGPYPQDFVVGLMAGALAQAGDLFESSLKRHFGAKDSSRLIPGHGGAMDRLDGFLTATVAAAVLGVARFGVDTPGAGLFRW